MKERHQALMQVTNPPVNSRHSLRTPPAWRPTATAKQPCCNFFSIFNFQFPIQIIFLFEWISHSNNLPRVLKQFKNYLFYLSKKKIEPAAGGARLGSCSISFRSPHYQQLELNQLKILCRFK